MVDTNNAGTAGAPDETSQGVLFRDGPEDLARIGRYEDYLRLQSRADNMSNAEYLEELDAIMKDGDRFDRGDSSYGQSGPGSAGGLTDAELEAEEERKDARDQEERVRANLEDGGPDGERADGNAALLEAETDGGPENGVPNEIPVSGTGAAPGTETPDGAFADVGAQDAPPEDGPPGWPGDEGLQEPARTDAGEESYLTADPVVHEPWPDDGEALGEDAAAHAASGEDEIQGGAVQGVMAADPEAGVPAGPNAVAAVPEDVPEETPAAPAYVPDEIQVQVQPAAGPVVDGDELENPPGAPAPGYATVPGHVETYEQPAQVNDILDEISVSTGLMDCVETSVYVPEKRVPAEPEGPGQQAPYYRTEKAQQLMDMAARDRQAEMEQSLPDGPSY